jgi:hypothetical protein
VKKIIIIIIAGLILASCVTYKITPVEERQVQKIHEINLSKDKIYDASLEWMARTFNDSKAVIEIKDKENGKIVGKGVTDSIDTMNNPLQCVYTMVIEIKDNKYRTTYNNFYTTFRGESVTTERAIIPLKENLIVLDNSLYSFIQNSTKSSNW